MANVTNTMMTKLIQSKMYQIVSGVMKMMIGVTTAMVVYHLDTMDITTMVL